MLRKYRFPSDTNATLFWDTMHRRGLGHLVEHLGGDLLTVDDHPIRGSAQEIVLDDLLLSYGAYVVSEKDV